MKIAFIWNFVKAKEIYPKWRDGLRTAIEEIGKTNDVDIYLGDDYKKMDEEYDAILLWTDSNDPIIEWVSNKKGKKGIILTTNPQDTNNLRKLDVVFCESSVVYDEVRKFGIRAKQAFGTDTDFYSPDPKVRKDIPYFYPATFSPWKRQRDIAHLGKKLYCVGTVQPDGTEDLEACKKNKVNIAIGYFKAEYIRDLYRRAKKVIIPAVHGSERTVLEAMSTDILPEFTSNIDYNAKLDTYVTEYISSGLKSPREFAVKNYSHKIYAEKILEGFS